MHKCIRDLPLTLLVVAFAYLLPGRANAQIIRTQCQAEPPSATPSPEKQDLPKTPPVTYSSFQFHPLPGLGMPVVRVRIDNKVDADFILDTGTSVTCIRSDFASDLVTKLGLKQKKATATGDSDANLAGKPLRYLTLDQFELNGALNWQVDAVVLDDLPSGIPPSVVGLIGNNLLAATGCAIFIDFEQQYIDFVSKGNLTAAQVQYLGLGSEVGGRRVSLKSDNTGVQLFAPMTVTFADSAGITGVKPAPNLELPSLAGDSGDLLIDTGSVRTTFVSRTSGPSGLPIRLGIAALHAGSVPVDIYRVASIGFAASTSDLVDSAATLHWDYTQAPFVCGFAASQYAQQSTVAAIGIDFLSHYRILLDYGGKTLYYLPIPHDLGVMYPTATSRENSQRTVRDVTVVPLADGRWEVKEIKANGTFGSAGLEAGDIIEAIDGQNTQDLFADEIAAAMGVKSGLLLSVSRGGKGMLEIRVEH